jgi:hypothetical protein
MADTAAIDRRVTWVVATIAAALAIPLIGSSALIAIDAVKKLPAERTGFLVLSFPLTFALVFGVVAVRGFASTRRIGPALSVRGWRLVAGALVVVAAIGTFGHWAGGVLPLIVAMLCLYNDPVVAKWIRLIALLP